MNPPYNKFGKYECDKRNFPLETPKSNEVDGKCQEHEYNEPKVQKDNKSASVPISRSCRSGQRLFRLAEATVIEIKVDGTEPGGTMGEAKDE
jgi:hypothetical protein